jgi:hypothetical protein
LRKSKNFAALGEDAGVFGIDLVAAAPYYKHAVFLFFNKNLGGKVDAASRRVTYHHRKSHAARRRVYLALVAAIGRAV